MQHSQQTPKKILIIGGGTAGWMAANLLAAHWPDSEICLIESKNIGIIGVGEGSTPHLKLFFDQIAVTEQEWMPRCHATYKTGITFANWSQHDGFPAYFHPFAAQTDDIFTLPLFFNNIYGRMQGYDVNAHPDDYFLQTHLARQQLGPIAAESFPFGIAYGYHFDSALLGQFLAEKAQSRGVRRVYGDVSEVRLHTDGSVQSVVLSDSHVVSADFFIDCTGFSSLLLQQTLGVRFLSYKENLFNDAAVVMPTPITSALPVETKATALSNGWAWQIPLTNRFGNGYVYSRDYLDADQAETELRQHLGLLDSATEARHLRMNVGRVEKHWHKNCLAVGLSQGFIEPLEATAIALSYNTIAQFIQYFQQGSYSSHYQAEFNNDINHRFEGIRDYIVCHYKTNQRQDTSYWRDNAANSKISANLSKILYLWRHSDDFAADMFKHQLTGSYQPKSWACMLSGYGLFPPVNPQLTLDFAHHQGELDAVKEFIRRCGLNFQEHTQLLRGHE